MQRMAGISSAMPPPFRVVDMAAFPQKEKFAGQPVAVFQMMILYNTRRDH